MTPNSLFRNLKKKLVLNRDAEKALAMKAYMKSAIPYHGINAPLLKKIHREVFSELTFVSQKEWIEYVIFFWAQAKFREEKYSALALSAHRSARAFQNIKAIPLYEKLITEGAWWDIVDFIASNSVGEILRGNRSEIIPLLLKWSASDNLWLRRTAILSQLKFKKETNTEFLEACILPSMASKEFFLRKAIGWALRQYAWTNPAYVKRYVKKHEKSLSVLSKREALKNI